MALELSSPIYAWKSWINEMHFAYERWLVNNPPPDLGIYKGFSIVFSGWLQLPTEHRVVAWWIGWDMLDGRAPTDDRYHSGLCVACAPPGWEQPDPQWITEGDSVDIAGAGITAIALLHGPLRELVLTRSSMRAVETLLTKIDDYRVLQEAARAADAEAAAKETS